jgi:hypothetical protein
VAAAGVWGAGGISNLPLLTLTCANCLWYVFDSSCKIASPSGGPSGKSKSRDHLWDNCWYTVDQLPKPKQQRGPAPIRNAAIVLSVGNTTVCTSMPRPFLTPVNKSVRFPLPPLFNGENLSSCANGNTTVFCPACVAKEAEAEVASPVPQQTTKKKPKRNRKPKEKQPTARV